MYGLVAAGGPAGALRQALRVVGTADEKLPGTGLLDEVTFQTQIRVPLGQQLGIDRAVRVVAGGAAFAQGFVFEHERTLLGRMAAQAHFIFR